MVEASPSNGEMAGLAQSWAGEQILSRYLAASRSWIFICLHSTRLGPGVGGTRLNVYDSPAAGLRDCMRLAEMMTVKAAIAGVPFGGGKSVLAVPQLPEGPERKSLFALYADIVASLRGTYLSGCDMNTSPTDLEGVADRCSCLFGGDPGPYTAHGVYHGIKVGLERVFGTDLLTDRTVVVEGVGSVGSVLAELLAGAGARVILADSVPERALRLAHALGAWVVRADEAAQTECDVYSPCATGGVISSKTVPGLQCRLVAGSANNQLASPSDWRLLDDRGILYAPDFVINSGGLLFYVGARSLGWDDEQLSGRLRGIGDTLRAVFDRTARSGLSPEEAARQMAGERLSQGVRVA